MNFKIVTFLSSILSLGSCSVIIPEELPSLLSVAYSNIPPIKKGTDSRVGFGFAFGNHADFQVLFELGPQTNTNNISQPFPTNTKRQAPSLPADKVNKNREKFLQSDPGKYLQNWAHSMKYPQKIQKKHTTPRPGEVPNLEDSVVELVKNDKGEFEIHQPRPGNLPQKVKFCKREKGKEIIVHIPTNIINSKVLEDLKRLYGLKKEEAKKLTEKKRTNQEIQKITEDLSNVDLD